MRIFYNFGKLLILLLIVWLAILVFLLGGPLSRTSETDELAKKLANVQSENRALTRERDKLLRQIRDINKRTSASSQIDNVIQAEIPVEESKFIDSTCEPSLQYEIYRRRAVRDTKELFNFIQGQLDIMVKSREKVTDANIQYLKDETRNHGHAILVDLQKLKENDGYEEWRAQESEDLSNLVQERLTKLQNPDNCDSAKKLLCNLNKGCGYGCQIHHAIYCFITAYGSQRTLILKSSGWRYNKKGFEEVFLPLSNTCLAAEGSSKSNWPGSDNVQVVEMPIIDSVNPRPSYLPPAIPADLSDRIQRLHGDPIVWWIGQFIKYMLRPQSHLKEMLDNTEKSLGLQHPIVGIHVRRTDKVGTEAAFHAVSEYMALVDEWYQLYELTHTVDKRRVYVASDDPKVLGECRKLYPEYEFLGDPDVSRTAAVHSRYSDSSLRGVIQDIHMLSVSDHLVCTFSSQVCRIAYEIMQNMHPDAADRFNSLDDIFYYGGQGEHQQEVIYPHMRHSSAELDLEVGDVIGVAGNHWDGFNKGRNHRTNKVGLYPEYKTKEKLKIVKFP